MARLKRCTQLPLRDGLAASTVHVPSGPWANVLDFLTERLPTLNRAEWQQRLQQGKVLDEDGLAVTADAPCPTGQRLHYWRWHAHEPELPEDELIVFQDEWLVVADKPHFMPVTPAGRFARQSLLARLRRRLNLADLSPLHRIDRDTAGLVVFAVQKHTRGVYQALFRDQTIDKHYEAVAPHRSDLVFPREHRSRLEPDPDRFYISREVAGTPNSHSRMDLVQVLGQHAWYSLQPISGQRHQLRLHMTGLGLPILGDAFYPEVRHAAGVDDWARPLQLLARELRFTDPVTGQQRHFVSSRQLLAAQGRWPDSM